MAGVRDVRATANVEVATCSATLTREQHLCMVFLSVSQVAEGNGPVNALAKALFRALLPQFPSLENVVLSDYKARNHTLFASQVSYGIRATFSLCGPLQVEFAAMSLCKNCSVAYAIQLLSPSIGSGSIYDIL